MALDRKGELLRAKAARALGAHKVSDVVAKVKAIIGPTNIPDTEPLAQAALDKLHNGEIPSAEEITALEIVVRLLRPVVYTRNGRLDDLPDDAGKNLQPQELKDLWGGFRQRVEPVIDAIGRIERTNGEHVGTGFIVAEGLLASNRHVLGALTFGSEVLAKDRARVVVKQEIDLTDTAADRVPILGVAAIHPEFDMVLFEIPKQGRPQVAIDTTQVGEGKRVVAIGYPGEDRLNNPVFLASVFQGKFGVRRAAVGEVLDSTETPALFHDCSTTRGNSGSPLFQLDSGKVIGIHRSGFFMYRSEAVDGSELQKFISSLKLDGTNGDPTNRISLLSARRSGSITPVPEELRLSEALVQLFHNGLMSQYEILRASSPAEAREMPSLAKAGAVLPGRILEVIASRARRIQIGILANNPLFTNNRFDYGFVQELGEHVPFRIDEGTEFFSLLHQNLIAHLQRGGMIGGRWGRLVLANGQIAIVTQNSAESALTDDELRALFESRIAPVDETGAPAEPDDDGAVSI
jgi:S1-C subfamily serine protease